MWSEDPEDYSGNPYYKKDPGRFVSLLKLANSSGRWISRNFAAVPDLAGWVGSSLPLLSGPEYNLTTKLIWIFTGRVAFPKCEVCGAEIGLGSNIKLPRQYRRTCSEECAATARAISGLATCRDRYGVDNVFQLESVKSRSADTKDSRYGNRHFTNPEARKRTCLRIYGAESNMRSEAGLAEYSAGVRAKYGVDFPLQSSVCAGRMADTCMKRYGRPDVSTPETVRRRRNTCLERYGVASPMQSHAVRTAAQKRYSYDSKAFDSSAELAFYIWLEDTGTDFEYQPDVAFEYRYGGKTRRYAPDFKVGGRFVEVKGDQFRAGDGTWRNPYDSSEDGLYEAKRRCCESNDVEIMYSDAYGKYVKYCEKKFHGKFWYRQFRNR